jgi:hypothetical protein
LQNCSPAAAKRGGENGRKPAHRNLYDRPRLSAHEAATVGSGKVDAYEGKECPNLWFISMSGSLDFLSTRSFEKGQCAIESLSNHTLFPAILCRRITSASASATSRSCRSAILLRRSRCGRHIRGSLSRCARRAFNCSAISPWVHPLGKIPIVPSLVAFVTMAQRVLQSLKGATKDFFKCISWKRPRPALPVAAHKLRVWPEHNHISGQFYLL